MLKTVGVRLLRCRAVSGACILPNMHQMRQPQKRLQLSKTDRHLSSKPAVEMPPRSCLQTWKAVTLRISQATVTVTVTKASGMDALRRFASSDHESQHGIDRDDSQHQMSHPHCQLAAACRHYSFQPGTFQPNAVIEIQPVNNLATLLRQLCPPCSQ